MTLVTVDDTNTSRIKYVGDWEYFKTNTNEYGTSAHSVWDNGATATFTFRGTSVAVYITLRQGTGDSIAATFRIDNGETVKVSKKPSSTASYHYQIFQSGTLPMGDHTLVITEKGENYFRLDSISYEDGSSQVQSSSNKVPVSSTTPATPPQPVQSSVLIKTSTLLLTETMTDTTVIQETTQPAFSEGLPQNLVGSSSSDGSPTTLLEPYAQSSHSGSAGASASSAPLITTYIDGVRTVTRVQVRTTATGIIDGIADVTSSDSQPAAPSVSAERRGMSTGAVVGIAVGLFVILIGFILLLFRLRRNSTNRSRTSQECPSVETSSRSSSSVWPRRNTTTTLTPYNVSSSMSGGFHSVSSETRLVDEKNRSDFGYPPDDSSSHQRGPSASRSFRRDTFSSTAMSVSPATIESHMSFANVDQRQQGYPHGGAYTDFSYLSSPPPPFGYTDAPPSLARVPSYRSTMGR